MCETMEFRFNYACLEMLDVS